MPEDIPATERQSCRAIRDQCHEKCNLTAFPRDARERIYCHIDCNIEFKHCVVRITERYDSSSTIRKFSRSIMKLETEYILKLCLN